MVFGLSFDLCDNIVSRYAVFGVIVLFVDAISPIPGFARAFDAFLVITYLISSLILY